MQLWAGIAQSLQRLTTGWTVRGSNAGGGRDFSHLSRPALGPTQPPVKWIPGLSRGKERPERAADPSPPSSAVVMKGQSYTSTPPMGCTACTEPRCLYKGAIQLLLIWSQNVQPFFLGGSEFKEFSCNNKYISFFLTGMTYHVYLTLLYGYFLTHNLKTKSKENHEGLRP